MSNRLRRFEAGLFLRLRRRPPVGFVERATFYLLLVTAFFFLLSLLPGAVGGLGEVILLLAIVPLSIGLIILLYRWVFGRLLWTVRNRLIVTCLLMGLAPVVLFATLAGIAAYVFSGQFATNTARAAMDEKLARVRTSSDLSAVAISHDMQLHPAASRFQLPVLILDQDPAEPAMRAAVAAWAGGKQLALDAPSRPSDLVPAPARKPPPPSWLHAGFNGITEIDGRLYLCSANSSGDSSHEVLDVATLPLDTTSLMQMAKGLGSISILPAVGTDDSASSSGGSSKQKQPGDPDPATPFERVQGGIVAAPLHFFDSRVFFYAPLHITVWATGQDITGTLGVISRPTLLYGRLFASSVRIGAFVRNALIVIAILFSLLELLAFLMALRLSRTITRSIADLYGATTQIDRGNLSHRIHVERTDQLAALATSFNAMTGSLEHLLEQQREKERIQNELEIAQEVQNNLFPHTPIDMPGFELHGICKPARSVSGDYYDFIHAGPGRLCLALGDISGKGISAALLMASLHSAVRAFRFAGNELHPQQGNGTAAAGGGFASPANLLSLLNRHLFSSTQPEKYATLFLACYDGATQELTYSNGGQLPPLLLCADGSVKRLDCGGSVVGLLDGLHYEEATVKMGPGDILIAYSDGVTEPENEFGEFGEERLLELIRQSRSQPLAAISSHAMRSLRSWIGEAEQPDDITLVLARQS